MEYYLAIDIGASSGRHIVGWREGDEVRTKEVYRFPNGVREENGHLTWDIRRLFIQVVSGILEAFRVFPGIESLSIDTWGVDYVLLKGNEEVLPVYAYRDSRTEEVIPKVHEKIPFGERGYRSSHDPGIPAVQALRCESPGVYQRHHHGHGKRPNRGIGRRNHRSSGVSQAPVPAAQPAGDGAGYAPS